MKNYKVGDRLAVEFPNHYRIYKVQKSTMYTVTLESGLIVGQDLRVHANVPIGLVRVVPVTKEIVDAVRRYKRIRFIMRYFRPKHRSLIEKASNKQLNGICATIRKVKENEGRR